MHFLFSSFLMAYAALASAAPVTNMTGLSRTWNNPACDWMQGIVDDTGGICSMPACDFLTDHGVHIHCEVSIFDLDNVEADALLNLCSPTQAASATVSLKEDDIGLGWSQEMGLDAHQDINIPGVSISVPGVASAGLVVRVQGDASGENLDVKLGLDACGSVFGAELCAESVPFVGSNFPIWLLDFSTEVSFICQGSGPTPPPPSPPPAPPTPAPPAPQGYHFDDPTLYDCQDDEEQVAVTGVDGNFCSPSCSQSVLCPTDMPPTASGYTPTALPLCVLVPGMENKIWKHTGLQHAHPRDQPNGCAMICGNQGKPELTCPNPATCNQVDAQPDIFICTYPESAAANQTLVESAPTHKNTHKKAQPLFHK